MATMKAVQVTGSMGSHTIILNVSAPKPRPQEDQILVKVHAAGITGDEVHWPELYQSSARIPGHDVSGTIAALGPDYSGPFQVGDEAFAMLKAEGGRGGQAEYVIAEPGEIAAKPHSISHAGAAVLPVPLLTAWEAIFQKANVQKGMKVLVTGASGAVGVLLVQIAAKILDCKVIALASANNHATLRSLGADVLVDYHTPNWEESISDVDAVLDTVGTEVLAKTWSCVKANGHMVTVADPPPPWAFGRGEPEELALYPAVKWNYFIVRSDGPQLAELGKLFDEGTLQPVSFRSFSVDEAMEAWRYAGQRSKKGKAVIQFV